MMRSKLTAEVTERMLSKLNIELTAEVTGRGHAKFLQIRTRVSDDDGNGRVHVNELYLRNDAHVTEHRYLLREAFRDIADNLLLESDLLKQVDR